MGYTPRIEWVEGPSHLPTVTMRLSELKNIRDSALQQIIKAQKVMKMRNPGNKKFQPYKEGDQVWLVTFLLDICPTWTRGVA
jgi:hypothetical protein